ncbi:MAG: amidohydrolase family protein [Bilophila wadsworthia]
MDAVDELGLMVETHGFRGAAIDPFLAKIPANHAKYYPIYAKCCEFDIPVVISTGMATWWTGPTPSIATPVYRRGGPGLPQLKIVVSHGCYPWVNDHHGRSAQPQRLSGAFRVRAVAVLEGYIQAANTMIGDKVIFASAHPFLDFKGQIALYRKLPFSPQALENIFYNNAAKLLGL